MCFFEADVRLCLVQSCGRGRDGILGGNEDGEDEYGRGNQGIILLLFEKV